MLLALADSANEAGRCSIGALADGARWQPGERRTKEPAGWAGEGAP